ncbi:MAG: MutH/Sau3AI family endonuclease [Deltaproteobacteria bacterium]|nr:MutH/Sau3AI family endonuclease [Deltaproteobacteria bacterium]
MNTDARVQRLLEHATALVGARLADIADGLGLPVPAGGLRSKGWSGQIIERELGTTEESGHGSARGPDFPELGIELKTVPVDQDGSPLESTAVCMIDPVVIAGESWESSTVRKKLQRILFVALEVPEVKGVPSVGDRTVTQVCLWSPSREEVGRLQADFEHIVRDYFRVGRGAELTGHVGAVLQVRPKAQNNRDMRAAYNAVGQRVALGKMGFYLRPAFVGAILRTA